MNIYFKILWFEDTVEWFRPAQRNVNTFIKNHELEPVIERRIGNEVDINNILSNEYDLILMDFNLAEGNSGDNIIQSIRDQNVLTDILFYSAQYEEMLKAITGKNVQYDEGLKEIIVKSPPIDGIYYVHRNKDLFYPKVDGLISKIVRRSQDVVNLRGVVLDNTSEFDNKMKEIFNISWQKISEDERAKIRKYTEDIIKNVKKDNEKKIDDVLAAKCSYTASLNSPDYIIDSFKKARIMCKVLDILVDKYGLEIENKYRQFAENYLNEIIIYRNALGHSMKNKNDKQEVYIGTKKDGTQIIFDEPLCRQLRASLNEYSKVFDRIVDHLTMNM
jgi:hypothetical protein